ncbi:MAG: phosphotransferase family protein [Gammaproteobacteria bacterium AqS3]|nr:phosphotransferase family protein [Gammaproteobacteria bacterium AqS3]
MADSDAVFDRIAGLIRRVLGTDAQLQSARILTGGASAETWRVVLLGHPDLILRRRVHAEARPGAMAMHNEIDIQRRARDGGVAAPEIIAALDPADELGEGYLMTCIEGETLGKRIARDDAFAEARRVLAHQCGEQLAMLHAVEKPDWAQAVSIDELLEQNFEVYLSHGEHIPVFEYAFRRLGERSPGGDMPACPQHGDFRNGNLVVHPEAGLAGVLDWELFHIGPRLSDLGWLCVNSWRFGNIEQTVGGFGERAELLAAYNSISGGDWRPDDLDFWIAWGSLRWGIICQRQARVHLDGHTHSLEHAAIGRRVSETVLDLLDALL